MPKREDEFWAGMKEPKGRGLCPFCGSSNVYYNKRYESWRCAKCERSFPSPSYGPGGDFGKEARWFGKTTEEVRRREFAEAARKSRAEKQKGIESPFDPDRVGYYREEYSRGSRGFPGWLKPVVAIVLLAMSAVVIHGLWGGEIVSFFSSIATSPPVEVSKPPPETSSGDVEVPTTRDGVSIFHNTEPPYGISPYQPVQLINNESATDPTWRELVAFISADETDSHRYIESFFACGAFAEEVHNNAEKAGIRAAWVVVHFKDNLEAHALNAFNTIDRGLVYVDCTGKDVLIPVSLAPLPGVEQKTFGEAKSWDKITYIEIGREYGVISLEVASSPAYAYYGQYQQRRQAFKVALEDYSQKVIAFNLEAEEYSRWIEGKTFYEGTAEALRAEQWFQELSRQENILRGIEEELDREGNSLGAFWEPLGIVKNVEIYW